MWHCVFCSHPTSVPRHWLECVHTSVYVLFSAWFPMCGSPHYHTYMERWVLLCSTGCMFQSLYLWSHNLVTMCPCISTWIYVPLTLHVCSIPFENIYGNMGTPLWHCEFVTFTIFHDTSWLECVHVSVHVFMSISLPFQFDPSLHNYMKPWVPLCTTVWLFQ